MLSRFKSALMNAVSSNNDLVLQHNNDYNIGIIPDYGNANNAATTTSCVLLEAKPYSRPIFLGLTNEETQVSADHQVRPIIVPRDSSRIPWCAGYAECINAGKSMWNEDQAAATRGDLILDGGHISLPYIMFSMFDGHAGYQVAVSSRLHLHRIILEKLQAIPGEIFFNTDDQQKDVSPIRERELVIGAIELAYRQMDDMVDIQARNGGGGCTAITVLFLNGLIYAAGAGDSRAVIIYGNKQRALTSDHTPDTETNRVRGLVLGLKGGELLKGHFTPLEFAERPQSSDVGTMVLYREPYMTGWAYKKLVGSDLKMPLVSGHGKRSRVMGTIGVTRGFGDHGLQAANTGVYIKPFLSSQPQIQTFKVDDDDLTERDCIIIATDGLWDVVTIEESGNILRKVMAPDTPSWEYRLVMAAQELVQAARGRLIDRIWRGKPIKVNNGSEEYLPMASVDDISVFVIPLYPYIGEHKQWKKSIQQSTREHLNDYSLKLRNSI
ncbi:hypothetical protein PV325_013065 [Microctonus aethiopoides]|uniref:PPM-type phosphatase domain-containing protein n=1 Tax=Microctonus aethiopoides TaxID=144406 RepID=A0AA39FR07_9HYME|nr:hypothetical protein PV325_013065 [Microctonus aethiopoides]KAK0098303.1 hypothetical protein PV326_009804 [Microctonus aethiopoides]KAK0174227.1 hypothetical protein PV328_007336 [Microctonus aethiopoides]